MCQTFKAVEIVRTYSNGSKEIITEVTCSRCSGNGVFQHLKHIDKGQCYKCNGTGVTEKSIKVKGSDNVEMVNHTTEVKQLFNTANHENEMVRKALKAHHEERKQMLKDAHLSYLKDLEEERQHQEDMKNNPDDYRFSWDD